MGAIQNSINAVLGTAAGAATIGKKLKIDSDISENVSQITNIEKAANDRQNPDYGKLLTNATAELQAIKSLQNAKFGAKNKSVNVKELINKAKAEAEERVETALGNYGQYNKTLSIARPSLDGEVKKGENK